MLNERIKLVVASYGIDAILDEQDVDPEVVLKLLVEEGIVEIESFFEELKE